MPSRKPTSAGTHAVFPAADAISIAGMSSDHTLAAIITPEAKPSRTLRRRWFISLFKKKTMAAPREVPARGISTPAAIFHVSLKIITLSFFG